MSSYASLTERLKQFMQGNQSVVDALLREVLPKLHEIAVRELKRERYMAPLSKTELIHEVWLSSLSKGGWQIHDQGHFCALASLAMRRVLVDLARKRLAARRIRRPAGSGYARCRADRRNRPPRGAPRSQGPRCHPHPDVLALAVSLGRVLVSHDHETMPGHLYRFLADAESPRLPIPQYLATGSAFEELHVAWVCAGADEFRNRIVYLPL